LLAIQAEEKMKTHEQRKVALVLSSGGARGLAHIGVIEGLEAHGYAINSIAGSSIGALVGAFYACGQLDTYKNWVIGLDRMDVFKLIDFTFSVQGFIRGEKIFKTLEAVIPDCNIEDMNIPFRAIATDLNNKKEVVVDKGSMYGAIKASVAIPMVIRPVEHSGRQLIDGAVINPVPVDRVPRTPGDWLVVSNVNAPIPYVPPGDNSNKWKKERDNYLSKLNAFRLKWGKLLPGTSTTNEKLGYFEVMSRSIDLMQDRMTELMLQHYTPDLRIDLSRDAGQTFEFYKAAELIDAGRKALEKAMANHLSPTLV